MHIDLYQFGKIVINGTTYNSDVIITGDSVMPDWYRKRGHSLSVEDLRHIISAKPTILVIGCGASGLMEVPEHVNQFLQQHNIQTEVFDTHQATKRFNKLAQEGLNVAAALHLTC